MPHAVRSAADCSYLVTFEEYAVQADSTPGSHATGSHAACAMQRARTRRHATCSATCDVRHTYYLQHALQAARHWAAQPTVAAAVAVEAVRSGRGQHATRHNVPASQDGFGRAALRGRVHALWTSPAGSSDGCAHTPTVVRSLPSLPPASPKRPLACANRLRLVVAPPPQL